MEKAPAEAIKLPPGLFLWLYSRVFALLSHFPAAHGLFYAQSLLGQFIGHIVVMHV